MSIKPVFRTHISDHAHGKYLSTFLLHKDTELNFNEPGQFTALNASCLIGVETAEGNVVVSKETWKRIEVLVTVFGCVKGDEKAYEQAIQPTMARTGESEVAGTEESTARGNSKAGLLPEMRQALPEEETTGAPP
jgi:hypothetical protein